MDEMQPALPLRPEGEVLGGGGSVGKQLHTNEETERSLVKHPVNFEIYP